MTNVIYRWEVVLEDEKKIENSWLVIHFQERIKKLMQKCVFEGELKHMDVFLRDKKFYTENMEKVVYHYECVQELSEIRTVPTGSATGILHVFYSHDEYHF